MQLYNRQPNRLLIKPGTKKPPAYKGPDGYPIVKATESLSSTVFFMTKQLVFKIWVDLRGTDTKDFLNIAPLHYEQNLYQYLMETIMTQLPYAPFLTYYCGGSGSLSNLSNALLLDSKLQHIVEEQMINTLDRVMFQLNGQSLSVSAGMRRFAKKLEDAMNKPYVGYNYFCTRNSGTQTLHRYYYAIVKQINSVGIDNISNLLEYIHPYIFGFLTACYGIHLMYSNGIVHNDIHNNNILISAQDQIPMIFDFDLAYNTQFRNPNLNSTDYEDLARIVDELPQNYSPDLARFCLYTYADSYSIQGTINKEMYKTLGLSDLWRAIIKVNEKADDMYMRMRDGINLMNRYDTDPDMMKLRDAMMPLMDPSELDNVVNTFFGQVAQLPNGAALVEAYNEIWSIMHQPANGVDIMQVRQAEYAALVQQYAAERAGQFSNADMMDAVLKNALQRLKQRGTLDLDMKIVPDEPNSIRSKFAIYSLLNDQKLEKANQILDQMEAKIEAEMVDIIAKLPPGHDILKHIDRMGIERDDEKDRDHRQDADYLQYRREMREADDSDLTYHQLQREALEQDYDMTAERVAMIPDYVPYDEYDSEPEPELSEFERKRAMLDEREALGPPKMDALAALKRIEAKQGPPKMDALAALKRIEAKQAKKSAADELQAMYEQDYGPVLDVVDNRESAKITRDRTKPVKKPYKKPRKIRVKTAKEVFNFNGTDVLLPEYPETYPEYVHDDYATPTKDFRVLDFKFIDRGMAMASASEYDIPRYFPGDENNLELVMADEFVQYNFLTGKQINL